MLISDNFLVVYLWLTTHVYGYMITENGDKTGKSGHKTTWYVMRGDKIAIPCHYKAPEDSANEDSKSFVWKIPPYLRRRYQANDDNQLVVDNVQLLDSTTLQCRSHGVTHQHTVLVVEEPIWANVSRSMRFVSAGSCLRETPAKTKLLKAITNDLCSFEQLIVMAKTDKGKEKKCRIKISSNCMKSPTSPRYEFDIKISIDVPNFETCKGRRVKPTCVNYEKVAQRLCVPQQKCHLDFMCHQNFSCIEQTQFGVYQDVIQFAYLKLTSLIELFRKKSSRLLYGLTPKLNALTPLETTAKCAHPGHKLTSHVICIPCIPHTYLEESDQPTADKCKTCENDAPPDRYGTSDCRRPPQNPPETVYRTWPKWMRIPRYLKFTTAVPTPPSTAPSTEAIVSKIAATTPVPQVTEPPQDSSNSLKALGIVALVLILAVVLGILGVQGKKYKEKFYSRYQQLREEERASREEEMKLLKQAKSRNRKKKSRSKSKSSHEMKANSSP